MYIYELSGWPTFTWDNEKLADLLTTATFLQGNILGKAQALGFDFQQCAILQNMTEEITKSSEIEGEILNAEQVRSSVAKRLNINNTNPAATNHYIDGIVEMMADATQNYQNDLTLKRLYGWHAALFPTGYSGMYKITVGALRSDKDGPMRVVSTNAKNQETVYFEAPAAAQLSACMRDFLTWLNLGAKDKTNPLIRAAIAHLWLVTLHPFDDGNGRIARAITDMMLARSENSPLRFYSMSAQIQAQKKEYYKILETTQKGSLDITGWLTWFLTCLAGAIKASDTVIDKIITKSQCWQKFSQIALDANQQKIINMLLDGFNGNLTSSKWATLCKCSQDTATRAIKYLLENNILQQVGQGRSTHYVLKV